jgi:hypothetical protein
MKLERLEKGGSRYKKPFLFSPAIFLILLFILLSPFPCFAETPISFGETISASITVSGEVEVYSFDAIAGDMVTVVIGTGSIYLDPYIRLYSPDGDLLFSAYGMVRA